MSKEHLSTYLNDHLAGAVMALEVIDQLATEAPDLKSILLETKSDIEADREQLIALMKKLDIAESRVRKAGAWFAEQIAEAKFEMDDHAGGLLGRLERLEALALGIEGKRGLWRALEAASATEATLGGLDYPQLIQRAKDQRERMESLRIQTARAALTLAA
jgi:hypothetical protein